MQIPAAPTLFPSPPRNPSCSVFPPPGNPPPTEDPATKLCLRTGEIHSFGFSFVDLGPEDLSGSEKFLIVDISSVVRERIPSPGAVFSHPSALSRTNKCNRINDSEIPTSDSGRKPDDLDLFPTGNADFRVNSLRPVTRKRCLLADVVVCNSEE